MALDDMAIGFDRSRTCFHDRREAGRALAAELLRYAGSEGSVVLALPRGGVPVAFEVAQLLRLPLDVFLVRKLGVPGQEELAMGAIASGGVRVLNEKLVARFSALREALEDVTQRELAELERREARYRSGRPPLELKGSTVILVDDGLATGASMRAAIAALKQQSVRRCIVGVPVAAPETCAEMAGDVDEIVCVLTPEDFAGVGQFYEDFSQTSDQEVLDLLARAANRFEAGPEKGDLNA